MAAREVASAPELLGAVAAGEWRYLAEGGAHVVFEHVGASPALRGRVLRVRKAPADAARRPRDAAVHAAADAGLTDAALWAGHPGLDLALDASASPARRQRAFAAAVLRPALAGARADAGEVAVVDARFLDALASAAGPHRPPHRVARAAIDRDARDALLLRDAGRLDARAPSPPSAPGGTRRAFAIEIKPKCGCVLDPNRLVPSTRRRLGPGPGPGPGVQASSSDPTGQKENAGAPPSRPPAPSRFRMHQALRVAKGEAARASAYEPLDLFRGVGADPDHPDPDPDPEIGSRARAEAAIAALALDPRNNFRVFRRRATTRDRGDGELEASGGVVRYPRERGRGAPGAGEGSGAAEASDLVAALGGALDGEPPETDGGGGALEGSRGGDGSRPDDGSCPDRLVRSLAALVVRALERSGALRAVLAAQRLDAIGEERAAELADALWRGTTFPPGSESPRDAISALRDFVVAKTAKDCSVVVACERVAAAARGENRGRTGGGDASAEDEDEDEAEGGGVFRVDVPAATGREDGVVGFRCRVEVVDLDWKSVAKLPEWLALEREIVRNWEREMGGEGAGRDAGVGNAGNAGEGGRSAA